MQKRNLTGQPLLNFQGLKIKEVDIKWWRGEDLNLRRLSRQIYSLLPLATREPLHFEVLFDPTVEPAKGIEPPTHWLQISCSAIWATLAAELSMLN